MVLAVRVAFPSNPKEFAMLMSFGFAIATMIVVLGSQTMLKLINGPIPFAAAKRRCPAPDAKPCRISAFQRATSNAPAD